MRLRLQKNRRFSDVEKRLANIMQAIEQGIIFDTTKERFAALEKEKKELEITILQEKIKKPFLTKEQIRFGIEKFGKLDIATKEGKQRLIDGFINAIYVYDDKITFAFNYKDGTRTVMLSELSDGKNNSDLKCQGAPNKTLLEPSGVLFLCHGRNLNFDSSIRHSRILAVGLPLAGYGNTTYGAPRSYNPNCIIITGDWFGFTFYLK